MCAVAWKASILAVQKAGKVHDATPVFLLRDTINDFIVFIFYDLYLTMLDRIPAIRYLYWGKKNLSAFMRQLYSFIFLHWN